MDAVRVLASIVLLAGCDRALGIEAAVSADASQLSNCPGLADADQVDVDNDGIGDQCDNCPLVANRPAPGRAQDDGDGDGVGDACDPHPVDAGDCLVALDRFRDAADLAAHWQVVLGTADELAITDGGLALTPPGGGGELRVTSRDLGPGTVEILATTAHDHVGVVAALADADPKTGYTCSETTTPSTGPSGNSVLVDVTWDALVNGIAMRITSPGSFSGTPIADAILIRLSVDETPGGTVELRCRVDFGFELGGASITGLAAIHAGNPGIAVIDTSATVRALALYAFQPGVACPATIYR